MSCIKFEPHASRLSGARSRGRGGKGADHNPLTAQMCSRVATQTPKRPETAAAQAEHGAKEPPSLPLPLPPPPIGSTRGSDTPAGCTVAAPSAASCQSPASAHCFPSSRVSAAPSASSSHHRPPPPPSYPVPRCCPVPRGSAPPPPGRVRFCHSRCWRGTCADARRSSGARVSHSLRSRGSSVGAFSVRRGEGGWVDGCSVHWVRGVRTTTNGIDRPLSLALALALALALSRSLSLSHSMVGSTTCI